MKENLFIYSVPHTLCAFFFLDFFFLETSIKNCLSVSVSLSLCVLVILFLGCEKVERERRDQEDRS